MRLDGSTACMAIEGATDLEVFGAYVRQVLCPFLKPGDLVVMDNLAAHKSEAILALIRQAGAEALFLPAYSPDFNPMRKCGETQAHPAESGTTHTTIPDGGHRPSAEGGHTPGCR